MKIETYKSNRNGNYYFRIKSRNGRIIASSEGYTTKQSRDKGINAITKVNSRTAVVEV